MGGYSHTNLNDVEDAAAKHGLGHIGEARFANAELDTEQTGVSFHRLTPDARQAFGHRHEEAEEVYVIVRGDGRLKLDDEVIEVERLDAIRVAPEVTRAFEAGDEGLEVLVFGSRHDGDGELDHDFWRD